MIEARKNRIFEALFYRVLKWQMRRRFHGIYVAGLEHVAALEPDRALIACANHTNWWDGFAVELLTRQFPGRSFYLAQEERHLLKNCWMRYLGVFGIDLDGSTLPGIRHALQLLRDPKTVLWLFAQGRIEHPSRPIEIKPGARFLAEKSGAQLLPVIFRYEWLIESRPSLFIQIGAPGSLDLESLARSIPTDLEGLLERFRPLFKPGMSLNKHLEHIGWLLGGTGPFERENR